MKEDVGRAESLLQLNRLIIAAQFWPNDAATASRHFPGLPRPPPSPITDILVVSTDGLGNLNRGRGMRGRRGEGAERRDLRM